MRVIDLNADIGEADNPDWAAAEAKILTAVSSANIACGGHAGDDISMRQTIRLAKDNGVSIGAHPAYPDRKNFGRKSLVLGKDISVQDLKNTLTKQITRLSEIAAEEGTFISYVKPHGALYNDAVKDKAKAALIVDVIKTLDPNLVLLGGPNSEMTRAANEEGLSFIAEGFIDRRYTDDGHLLSRSEKGAVLETDEDRVKQAIGLVFDGVVQTNTGQTLSLQAQSLCLHGDSDGAVKTAFKTRKALEDKDVKIQAFADKKHLTYV